MRTGAAGVEETRIREAYARRRQTYSWFDAGYVFMVQERQRAVLAALARNGMANLADKRILDVGCGTGAWLRDFIQWGASPENLCGIDLLKERVQAARRLLPATVELHCGSARRIEAPDGSFDIVLQATMFTSILDSALKQEIAREMVRAVRSGGLILWYDFLVNNQANPDVRGVTRSEMHRLFPDCKIRLQRVTLAPPIARRLAPRSRLLCLYLERVPWLCTHFLAVLKPKREA